MKRFFIAVMLIVSCRTAFASDAGGTDGLNHAVAADGESNYQAYRVDVAALVGGSWQRRSARLDKEVREEGWTGSFERHSVTRYFRERR